MKKKGSVLFSECDTPRSWSCTVKQLTQKAVLLLRHTQTPAGLTSTAQDAALLHLSHLQNEQNCLGWVWSKKNMEPRFVQQKPGVWHFCLVFFKLLCGNMLTFVLMAEVKGFCTFWMNQLTDIIPWIGWGQLLQVPAQTSSAWQIHFWFCFGICLNHLLLHRTKQTQCTMSDSPPEAWIAFLLSQKQISLKKNNNTTESTCKSQLWQFFVLCANRASLTWEEWKGHHKRHRTHICTVFRVTCLYAVHALHIELKGTWKQLAKWPKTVWKKLDVLHFFHCDFFKIHLANQTTLCIITSSISAIHLTDSLQNRLFVWRFHVTLSSSVFKVCR